MIDDTVERLYQRLAEALQRSRRDAFTGPVTVAEIYQELVPYRVVRGEVGFDMNADYEHALLRLLAGEGNMARLEPAHAREQITKELRSSNPNVSIYREYAGCDVFVNQPAPGRFETAGSLMDDVLSDDDDVADPSPWDDVLLLESEDEEDALPFSLVDHEPEPKPQPVRAQAAQPQRPAPPPDRPPPPRPDTPLRGPAVVRESAPPRAKAEARAEPVSAGETTASTSCPFCDSALPGHRPVRYCPYCGQDLTAQPCPSCGETMEAGWMFCVSCGVARGTP